MKKKKKHLLKIATDFFLKMFFVFKKKIINRWGLTSLMIYNVVSLLSEKARNKLWLTSFNLAVAIAIGVAFLSLFQCSLLQDAVNDLGASGFVLGNWAVHYYPVLKLFAQKPKIVGTHISPSLSLLVCYLAAERAEQVYGCPLPHDAITYGAIGMVPLTLILYYKLHVS